MRLRITGVVLVLLGLVAAGTAVASATLWRPADHVRAEALASGKTTMLVTAPGVLELVDDTVTIRATAAQGTTVVVAVGREADVEAWVGTDAYTVVTGLADAATLATEPGQGVEPPVASPSPTPAASTDPSTPAASPTGSSEPDDAVEGAAGQAGAPADPALSDMWIAQSAGDGAAELSWSHRPGRWALLVATTGADAGQPTLELTWPREVVTPWFRPGLWLGGVLTLAGAVLLAVAWSRRRSSEPAWVGVDDEAAAPASSPEVAADPGIPAAPLTRRQLRELEAARGSARSARPVPTVRRGGAASGAEPATPEPTTPEPTTPEPTGPEPTTPEHLAAPAAQESRGRRGDRPERVEETQVIATPFVPDRPAETGGDEAPYVPTFVPSRRGGVVPHIPATPAAPAAPARWTPTGAGGETPAPSWPSMGPAMEQAPATEHTTPADQSPSVEPTGPIEPETDDSIAAPASRAPFGLRRSRRRAEPQHGPGPEHVGGREPSPPIEPGPELVDGPAVPSAPVAAPRSDPGSASADAWRARWGFVEMPAAPPVDDAEHEEGHR